MDHPSFRDWMRQQRVLRDLTQESLAEEVGCAVQTIRAFENGWRRPSRPLAERLATILAVPPVQRDAFLQAARVPVPRSAVAPAPPTGPADHYVYLRQLAEEMPTHLYGADQHRYLDQLDAELHHIREALAWAFDTASPTATRVEIGLGAASAIERFWHGRGHQAEGQRWLEGGIELVDQTGLAVAPTVLATALGSAGWLAKIRGDWVRAMALLQRCVASYRILGDAQGTSDALDTLGDLAIFDGDAITAAWFYEESLALRRGLGQPALMALSMNGLGHAAILRGYYERAAEHFQESLAILRELHDRRSTALALHGLGLARLRQGSLSEAAQYLHEALNVFHALDNTLDVALCLELLGELLALRVLTGDADDATIIGAAQLWGASEQLMGASGARLTQQERVRRDSLMGAARQRIGAERFEASWNEGRALTQDEAVTVGRGIVGNRS